MFNAARIEQIIETATPIATEQGLHMVTCTTVAKLLQITHGNVLHHVGTADNLRSLVARRAIREGNKKILANMITTGHPLAREIPVILRREVLEAMV